MPARVTGLFHPAEASRAPVVGNEKVQLPSKFLESVKGHGGARHGRLSGGASHQPQATRTATAASSLKQEHARTGVTRKLSVPRT